MVRRLPFSREINRVVQQNLSGGHAAIIAHYQVKEANDRNVWVYPTENIISYSTSRPSDFIVIKVTLETLTKTVRRFETTADFSFSKTRSKLNLPEISKKRTFSGKVYLGNTFLHIQLMRLSSTLLKPKPKWLWDCWTYVFSSSAHSSFNWWRWPHWFRRCLSQRHKLMALHLWKAPNL